MSHIIELAYNPGGELMFFMSRARKWAKDKATLVITDQQVSSAGIAVLEARKLGVPIFWKKRWFASPTLYLHQTKLKSRDGKSWVFRDDAAEYGFPSPVNGYRKVTMQELGIPEYKGKLKPDQVIPAKVKWW